VPHFRSLSRLARGHGLSSHQLERNWREVFETAFTELIEAVLHFRLKLLATCCEHSYTWPNYSDSYLITEMDNQGASQLLPLDVLFTILPGLKVKGPNSNSLKMYPGMKAKVKVKKPRVV